MNDDSGKLNPIETALGELAEAQRARVFHATRVDASALLAAPTSGPWWNRSRRTGTVIRGLAIAAVLALAVGVWGWMFAQELGSLRPPAGCEGKFQDCLTGPLAQAGSARGSYDHDSDGDVDLRDIRELQNSYHPISR